MTNKELFIKVDFASEMFVYAELKNINDCHRLDFPIRFKLLVEDSDYVVVSTKPKCIVIIANPDDRYEYTVVTNNDKSLDNRFIL